MMVSETTPMPEMCVSPLPMIQAQMWNLRRFVRFLTGITRDANGSPLGTVSVNLITFGAGNYGSIVSDANGVFTFVWYAGKYAGDGVTYTLVAEKAGAPDVAGASDSNLLPA